MLIYRHSLWRQRRNNWNYSGFPCIFFLSTFASRNVKSRLQTGSSNIQREVRFEERGINFVEAILEVVVVAAFATTALATRERTLALSSGLTRQL